MCRPARDVRTPPAPYQARPSRRALLYRSLGVATRPRDVGAANTWNRLQDPLYVRIVAQGRYAVDVDQTPASVCARDAPCGGANRSTVPSIPDANCPLQLWLEKCV